MKIPQKVADICALLDDKKANDILVCDTSKLNNVADFFVIATGDSPAHLNGISDYVIQKAQENQEYFGFVAKEGFILSQWIVLDFDNVIVHLFVGEEREKYSLSKLLNDGHNQVTFKKLQSDLRTQKKKQDAKQRKIDIANKKKEDKIEKETRKKEKLQKNKAKTELKSETFTTEKVEDVNNISNEIGNKIN